jgi:hypothetical protein
MSTIPWGEYGDTAVSLFPSGKLRGFQIGMGATTNPDLSLDLNIMSISALLESSTDCTQIPTHADQSDIIISQGE